MKELSCGAHYSPGFAVQLTDSSPNLHKNAIQDISSYVSPRVTWRHHVHHYRLREARCLLEASAPLIRMTQPRDKRGTFFYHISGPRTSITFQRPEHSP